MHHAHRSHKMSKIAFHHARAKGIVVQASANICKTAYRAILRIGGLVLCPSFHPTSDKLESAIAMPC